MFTDKKTTLNIYETFTWFYSERAIYSFIAGRPQTKAAH